MKRAIKDSKQGPEAPKGSKDNSNLEPRLMTAFQAVFLAQCRASTMQCLNLRKAACFYCNYVCDGSSFILPPNYQSKTSYGGLRVDHPDAAFGFPASSSWCRSTDTLARFNSSSRSGEILPRARRIAMTSQLFSTATL